MFLLKLKAVTKFPSIVQFLINLVPHLNNSKVQNQICFWQPKNHSRIDEILVAATGGWCE